MFETQAIFYKMTENNISLEDYTPAEGTITSLSQLTKEKFHDLMTSYHPAAKNYQDYSKKESEYLIKSYESSNDLFNRAQNL